MSYYYGYYGYGAYGADTAADEEPAPVDDAPAAYDTYYEDAPATEMEEDDGDKDGMMMMKMAWGVSIIADFTSWWINDDKWGTTNSDWTNATDSMLFLGLYRTVTMVAGMAVPAIHDMFMPLAAISLVWEGYTLYLVNKAEGASASDTSSTTIAYVCGALGVLGSAKVTMGSMMSKDDDMDMESADYYGAYDAYYEEPAPADEPADEGAADSGDSYGGYGGYSYYGYYY